MMVNEAVRCLEEGVISSPRDGDLGAVLGLGFPPLRGGPFHHIDTVGPAILVDRMEKLATRYGPRFEPAVRLVEMAERGARFYPARPG
jgi:3-hydroxyacyl-CoA dehydrogenase/enoyl-CoA hydratase/3-hydroxybutyryl-CoA epimerase